MTTSRQRSSSALSNNSDIGNRIPSRSSPSNFAQSATSLVVPDDLALNDTPPPGYSLTNPATSLQVPSHGSQSPYIQTPFGRPRSHTADETPNPVINPYRPSSRAGTNMYQPGQRHGPAGP